MPLWALPGEAGAAVTIGSDLAPDPVQAPSGAGTDARTIATIALPGQQVSSPLDGVVVRWRVRLAGANIGGNPVRLKVVRPAASGAYTGINTSATRTVPDSAVPTTFTFATRQPIGAADLIALDISSPNGNFIVQTNIQPGVHIARWQPMPLLDGQTRTPDNDPSLDYGEHTFNADVEPDADGDGYGDETQDQCPTDASTQGACPPDGVPSNEFSFGKLKKNEKKGTAKLTVTNLPGPGELELAKNKKVKPDTERVEAAAAGTTQDGISAKLKIKPKRKAKKKLNRKGKAKVKAEVTYTPDGGEPNTKSKKVGLKKKT